MRGHSSRHTRTCSTLLLFLLLLLLPAGREVQAGTIRLSVAASLREAISAIIEDYRKLHPETTAVGNYAASGTLARQIDQGAPADIYISANRKWMDFLCLRHAVAPGSISTLASNTLVFTGRTREMVTSMADLPRLQRIAIGSPKSVPAGDYALQAIIRSGLEKALQGKLIMARDVRECLMYAELGEVDGGFVYRTDALLATKATIRFRVPQELYPPIGYPMALTPAGAENPEARAFFEYLRSRNARAILEGYGFIVN